jgi:hypothetical protein
VEYAMTKGSKARHDIRSAEAKSIGRSHRGFQPTPKKPSPRRGPSHAKRSG